MTKLKMLPRKDVLTRLRGELLSILVYKVENLRINVLFTDNARDLPTSLI